MEHSEIAEFLRLVAGHPGAPGSSRLRQIILDRRPAFAVCQAGVEAVPSAIPELSDDDRTRLVTDIPGLAAGVGLLVANTGDGEPRRIGTAFRIAGGERRMLTCRHNLRGMLLPGHRTKRSRPFRAVASGGAAPLPSGQGLWPCRVLFPGGSRRINPALLWVHPAWDLMLFDLEEAGPAEPADAALPPLPIETDRHWGGGLWTDRIAVLGYPLGRTDGSPDFHPFTAGMGALHVSPGIRSHRPPDADSAATVDPHQPGGVSDFLAEHDASTYKGHSGSPVIALETGRVLGVHVQSGTYEGDGAVDTGNRHVMIAPAMDREDALRHAILGIGDPTAFVAWHPDVSGVDTGLLESDAPLETVLFDGGGDFFSTVSADMPDPRDAHYQPAFSRIPDRLLPPASELPRLRTQTGPDCVGHAVATALDILLMRADGAQVGKGPAAPPRHPVSARMLYETARLFDEFADDRLGGSSLRGALKGLFHSGVGPAAGEPKANERWFLTRDLAEAAREVRLTAYYRLRENISDIQHAVATTGAVLVSAHIHEGWRRENANGTIPWPNPRIGRHAFVIIGYDRDGWYVRNSWGARWSSVKRRQGVALWSYEDWRENMIDAWALQLAPRTPKALEVPAWVAEAAQGDDATEATNPVSRLPLPRRHSLIGHALQVERDHVAEGGRLGLGLDGLRETALYLRSARGRRKYRRIALLCHDPFLGSDNVARISGEVVGPLKRDGIYPINLAYGLEEAETIRLRMAADAARLAARIRGSGEDATPYLLRLIEKSATPLMKLYAEGLDQASLPGRPLWQIVASLGREVGPFRRDRRELLIVSLGAGGLVASVLARLFSDQFGPDGYREIGIGSLRPTGAEAAASAIAVPLAETIGANAGLHGFSADWCDLVACAARLGGHRDAKGTIRTSAELYARLIKDLRTKRFAHVLDQLDGRAASAILAAKDI